MILKCINCGNRYGCNHAIFQQTCDRFTNEVVLTLDGLIKDREREVKMLEFIDPDHIEVKEKKLILSWLLDYKAMREREGNIEKL